VVTAHDAVHDRQAEARSGAIATGRVERFEEARHGVGGDAAAGVAHGETRVALGERPRRGVGHVGGADVVEHHVDAPGGVTDGLGGIQHELVTTCWSCVALVNIVTRGSSRASSAMFFGIVERRSWMALPIVPATAHRALRGAAG
jgi:hypothetical protein